MEPDFSTTVPTDSDDQDGIKAIHTAMDVLAAQFIEYLNGKSMASIDNVPTLPQIVAAIYAHVHHDIWRLMNILSRVMRMHGQHEKTTTWIDIGHAFATCELPEVNRREYLTYEKVLSCVEETIGHDDMLKIELGKGFIRGADSYTIVFSEIIAALMRKSQMGVGRIYQIASAIIDDPENDLSPANLNTFLIRSFNLRLDEYRRSRISRKKPTTDQ